MALMENKKQIFVLVAAVAIGLVAAVLVSNFVQTAITTQTENIAGKFKKDQELKDEATRQQIQAFNQRIAEFEQMTRQGEQAVAKVQAAQEAKRIEEIRKKPQPLSLRMPPGKRALTLQIDVLKAVGGLLSPGDYVDIIAQLDIPSGGAKDVNKKDSVTAMIFQNIQVMAINGNVDQPGVYDEQQKNTSLKITLAVAPDEASLLSFAEKNGKIELALRSPNEKKPAMISAATWSTLAEYVLENTGADIPVPSMEAPATPVAVVVETPKNRKKKPETGLDPSILVYKAGKGAN